LGEIKWVTEKLKLTYNLCEETEQVQTYLKHEHASRGVQKLAMQRQTPHLPLPFLFSRET
jgi:hypothetical protein